MAAVESLVRKLSEVQELLISLPDDAFAEREALIRRRDELRSQAEHYAAGADRKRPTEDLLHELDTLRRRLSGEDIGDRLRIEGRIDRIESILSERRVEQE